MKIIFLWSVVLAAVAGAQVKVASLHPLMGDLVRQVGGERVSVVDIGKQGMDVHAFAPTAKDLQAMASCQLVVASGKGLEHYLPALQDSLGAIPIFEVGKGVPSRQMAGGDVHACCPTHAAKGSIDPHWWHNVKHMERAVKLVEKQLVKMDKEGEAYYSERSKVTRGRYKELDRWVKSQVASIPQEQRSLVTAHAAFGYFCDAYKMDSVFVLGMTGEHEVPARELAIVSFHLKKGGLKTVFPEKKSNPKVLTEVAQHVGAKVGSPLIADGAVASYETMVQQNVTAIVQGLAH